METEKKRDPWRDLMDVATSLEEAPAGEVDAAELDRRVAAGERFKEIAGRCLADLAERASPLAAARLLAAMRRGSAVPNFKASSAQALGPGCIGCVDTGSDVMVSLGSVTPLDGNNELAGVEETGRVVDVFLGREAARRLYGTLAEALDKVFARDLAAKVECGTAGCL